MSVKKIWKDYLFWMIASGILAVILLLGNLWLTGQLQLNELIKYRDQDLLYFLSITCFSLSVLLGTTAYSWQFLKTYKSNNSISPEDGIEQINLLIDLITSIQICFTVAETGKILHRFLPEIFPNTSGGVFILDESKSNLVMLGEWGNFCHRDSVLIPRDCICLRQGYIYVNQESEIQCQYSQPVGSGAHICIPMLALGEVIGVFTIDYTDIGQLSERKKELIIAISRQIALGIANVQLREKLRNESIKDVLTGLYNRRYLEECLEREFCRAKRNNSYVSIIMLDVDHFKYFNDTFGHDAGDAVLQEIGNYLKHNVRGEDIPCRYGGEEFTLVLLNASKEDAVRRAEQMREEIKTLRVHRGKQALYSISVSMGVACFPEHGNTPRELIKVADIAMYQAKAEGRDRVILA